MPLHDHAKTTKVPHDALRGAAKRSISLLARLCELHPELGRDHWYAAVACGQVIVDGERVREPHRKIATDATVTVRRAPPLASRAGYKLSHALRRFGISVAGKVVLDAGAATGGFTDCLLRRGARHVHCVDVAYGALAYRLRTDPRTSVHERTNVMHLVPDRLQPPPDGAVCDLSFRSLRCAAARLIDLTGEGWLIALIKPQFEWRAGQLESARAERSVRFDGRVRGARAVVEVVERLLSDLAGEGVVAYHCAAAPLPGRRGNREVMALLTATDTTTVRTTALLDALRGELESAPSLRAREDDEIDARGSSVGWHFRLGTALRAPPSEGY